MTTSEESIAPATPAPKYRYFTALPEILYLKVEDLTAFLPEGAWIGPASDKQREVPVPAAKILETNYPRIDFSRLCDLLPGCIQRTADAPDWVALPADRVALAYRPETRRELLPDALAEKPPVAEAPPSPAEPESATPMPSWKLLPKPVLAPAPEPVPPPETKTETLKPPVSFADLPVPAPPEGRLAEIFGAETFLSVQQLVEKCRTLPAVKACLLRRGAESVKSGAITEGLDRPDLSAEVFAAVRKISAAAGLKLRKALTFYTEAGPISVLRHRGLILVVHGVENGLAAETHAKLKMILQAIERASSPKD